MKLRILLIILFIHLILLSSKIDTSVWKYSDCGGFNSYPERVAFQKLVRKHGLKWNVNVVWEEDGEWVYYRENDGQRCKLK
jgi:phage pi2 protein 07